MQHSRNPMLVKFRLLRRFGVQPAVQVQQGQHMLVHDRDDGVPLWAFSVCATYVVGGAWEVGVGFGEGIGRLLD